jgi:streptomycin 6-kinase
MASPRVRWRYGYSVAADLFGEGVRERLRARFGDGVARWFAQLPDLLDRLAVQWRVQFDAPIPRGSVSVVLRCQTEEGRPAVLKASPDRIRIATEARALSRWSTSHAPRVLAADADLGALLIEAIHPGTPLADLASFPRPADVAALLTSLHTTGRVDRSYPTVAARARYLFDTSVRLYERHPQLIEVVSSELYERGRRLASRLAEDVVPPVLVHGDLTPSNILDGGPDRGLVAIDPAPCVGDAAFDAVDLMLWRAERVETVEARVACLSAAGGLDTDRVLEWCIAFAGMAALEAATTPGASGTFVDPLVTLAERAPGGRPE